VPGNVLKAADSSAGWACLAVRRCCRCRGWHLLFVGGTFPVLGGIIEHAVTDGLSEFSFVVLAPRVLLLAFRIPRGGHSLVQ